MRRPAAHPRAELIPLLFLLVLASFASASLAAEVTFKLNAPGATNVFLAGEFNGWDPAGLALSDEDGDGVFETTMSLDPGTYTYKFVIDGTWKEDPAAAEFVDDSFGGKNSVLTIEAGATELVIGPAAAETTSEVATPEPTEASDAPAGQRNVRFRCKASEGASVFLAGEFNGWDAGGQAMTHAGEDVFEYVMPLSPGRYAFKYVINGNWSEDPFAADFVDDSFGGKNSVVEVVAGDDTQDAGDYSDMSAVPSATVAPTTSTTAAGEAVTGSRSVTFSYQPLISGVSEVHLAGTFNDWNVGVTPMTDPDGNGIYEATLLLAAGDYQYKFVVDGNWITDENADDFADDNFGGQNGVIHVDTRYDAIDVELGDGEIFTEGIEPGVDYGTINEHGDGEFLVQTSAYRDDVERIFLHWQEQGAEAKRLRMIPGSKDPVQASFYREVPATPGVPVSFTFEYVDGDGHKWVNAQSQFVDEKPATDDWLAYSREVLPLFRVPEWAQDGIFYQIFPERFANGRKDNDQDFTEAYYDEQKTLPESGFKNGAYFHFVEDWNEVEGLQASPYRTDGRPDYFSFYGGDIAGIKEKIPYLAELGITIIYFNPITEARSNHRYDPCDYLKLDPHLGTEEEFIEFSKACLDNGIRIIVDMAYNHTGDCHFAFQDVLANWKDSEYYDWYEWKKQPPRYPLPEGEKSIDYYDCWWGFGLHPNLNFDLSRENAQENGITNIEDAEPNWPVVNYLLDSADYWLGSMGCAGFRLDVPNEVPFWFWSLFRERCRQVKSDHLLVGEIWGDAGSWISPNVFDSVMNYRYFKDPVVKWIGQGNGNAATFDLELAGGRTRYPIQAVRAQMNLVDSHDTIRFLQVAGEDARRLRLSATFGMTYVGAPHIYYGNEVAMTGGKDPDCRRTMPWDQVDLGVRAETFDHFKTVTALRRDHEALRRGSFTTVMAEGQVYAYLREHEGERLLVALNNSESEVTAVLPVGNVRISDGASVDVLLGEETALAGDSGGLSVTRGTLRVTLAPIDGVVLRIGSQN